MASGYITLAEIAARTDALEIACTRCPRRGRYRMSTLIERYGPDGGGDWLARISADCPRRVDPHPSIYELCGIHCPELSNLFLANRR